MSDKAKTGATEGENAPGGRNPSALSTVTEDKTKKVTGPEGFGLNGEDVKGSLKIHIKLDLEADIHITARLKGDIAIGLL